MSYSARKIRNYVDDPHHQLPVNAKIAQQFFLAEDDFEVQELRHLLSMRRVNLSLPPSQGGGNMATSSSAVAASSSSSRGWGWFGAASSSAPSAATGGGSSVSSQPQTVLLKDCHVVNMHGGVRGVDAALALLRNERETLKLYWTSPMEPLTANTFERRGYLEVSVGLLSSRGTGASPSSDDAATVRVAESHSSSDPHAVAAPSSSSQSNSSSSATSSSGNAVPSGPTRYRMLPSSASLGSVPLLGRVWRKMMQHEVRELLVVEDGRVVYRELGLAWRMLNQ